MFKMLVVLACMTLGIVGTSKGQTYSNYLYFTRVDGDYIFAIKFEGKKAVLHKDGIGTRVWFERALKSGLNTFEEDLNIGEESGKYAAVNGVNVWQYIYYYDSEKSTSARDVYKRHIKGSSFGPEQDEFIAISKDKSSIIEWQEDTYTSKISPKIYYSQIPKEDLLPKAANYDFLNE